MEQPAFTQSRTPAGGTSAALSLRSNVVGTYGSPTNAPSLYIRTPIARELLPAGAGSFCLLKLCSRVSDCYSAPLPLGTPRGCFFIWSNRLLPKAGRLRAGVLHIQRKHCALPFCRDCPGSPEGFLRKITLGRCIGKNYLTKSDKFTVRSLIHSFSFTTWW